MAKNNKVYNIGGNFKVASNASKTVFGTSIIPAATELVDFPGMTYASQGDTHDSLSFINDNQSIAEWDDNDGNDLDFFLLLYIKTSTAELAIYKKSIKYEFYIPKALLNKYVKVVYNGTTTIYYADEDKDRPKLSYELGTGCSLQLDLASQSISGVNYYAVGIGWNDIPNLQKIGGGIALVLRHVCVLATANGGTGKPSFWSGGHGSITGYDYISGFTKMDLVAAYGSTPGEVGFDKVVFNWGLDSELRPLAMHSMRSILDNSVNKYVNFKANTDVGTTDKEHGLAPGSAVCIIPLSVGGLSNTTYYVKDVTPTTFKLAASLSVDAPTVNITADGDAYYHAGWCFIICPPPNIIENAVNVFDPLPFVELNTSPVGTQGMSFIDITP